MPTIVDKIADALHLNRHHKHEEPATTSTAEGSAAPVKDMAAGVTPATEAKSPVFDHEKVTVLFVLGGPGAGELLHLRKTLSSFVLTTSLRTA